MKSVIQYNILQDFNFVVQSDIKKLSVERINEDGVNTLLLPTLWSDQPIRATPGPEMPLFYLNQTAVLNDKVNIIKADILCFDGVIHIVDTLIVPPILEDIFNI
mmetsp:Transcript_24632/g.35162  ORF Transcript_24632/g.35162 Transcript_24632/m.35162 type:complete len:104 (+) Transcript_24632:2-313(+)